MPTEPFAVYADNEITRSLGSDMSKSEYIPRSRQRQTQWRFKNCSTMRQANTKPLQARDCHELPTEANEIMRYADDRKTGRDEAGQERTEPLSALPSQATAQHSSGARSDADGDLADAVRSQPVIRTASAAHTAQELERLRTEKAGAEAESRRAWEIVRQEAAKGDAYRVEADKCMSEYDALMVDVGIMASALKAIAEARPNKQFDPWARGVANDALWNVSERVRHAIV